MKNQFILCLAIFTFSLTACSEKTETHSVDEFYENNELRQSVLNDCKARIQAPSDLEKVMKEPNCHNAAEAQTRYAQEFSRTGSDKKVQQWQ